MSEADTALVLVVDDEPENRRALSRQLAAEQFDVVTANSGLAALEQLRRCDIDIVLMDVVMPDMDGIEATRLIKQDPVLCDVPVVVVTGFVDAPARMRALSVGAAEFLARPIDRTEMAVRLRNLLKLRHAHEQLKQRNIELSRLLEQESQRVTHYEHFTRGVFDALTANIAILDASGTIMASNQGFSALTRRRNVPREVGDRYAAEQLANASDAARLREAIEGVMRGSSPQAVLDYALDDRRFTARVTRFGAGDQAFTVVAHEDVTEQENTRMALRETQTKLEESQQQVVHAQKLESVGRLTGGVAHDFNNMLTSIICFTRFVVDDMVAEDPRRADLIEVLRSADNAARLVNQLLAFSRRKPQQSVLVNVNEALSSVGRVLRRTLGERIQLEIKLAEQALYVVCDPGQFDQLVFNLAVNAKDAMPEGGTIRLRLAQVGSPEPHALPAGDYVELLVVDTGEGMSPEVAARAFEPFFTTKGDRGTGLGLATCQAIAQQVGGAISFRSSPGGGCSVRVLLPRGEEQRRPAGASRSLAPMSLKATALVVEDQPAILRTMVRALEGTGMVVIEAGSAEDALALLEAKGVVLDLVVTDMVLPRVSGQGMVERLRAQQPQLRVLFVSGYLGDEHAQPIRVDDITAFLAKPFTGRQLVARAAGLLGAGKSKPWAQ